MYKIRCTVSGGVTGFRSAYLKSDGVEVEFQSMKDAEVEASRLTKEMNSGNGGRYGARFSYVAVDVD